jgi:hypothetical protein
VGVLRSVAIKGDRAPAAISALTGSAQQLGLPAPNADFGLAALTYAIGLPPDAARTISRSRGSSG